MTVKLPDSPYIPEVFDFLESQLSDEELADREIEFIDTIVDTAQALHKLKTPPPTPVETLYGIAAKLTESNGDPQKLYDIVRGLLIWIAVKHYDEVLDKIYGEVV